MAQSTQNQIFRELTVPDIVHSELSSISKKGSHPLVRDGLSVDDYEIYTIRDYDECEYVVQYKETDHNFISRLMEHEGIYYYFEQDDIREKLVVTDAMATEEIGDDSYAIFQTEASASHYDTNVVYKLNRLQKQIPDSVLIKDFNYRSPSMPMQSDSLVDENGIGFVTEFGAHFKEPEQGQVLATLRAEEFRCRQNVYTGESNIAAMTCAGLYSLGQHFRREYNQSYMITRVQHSGSQEIESWGNVGSTRYNNEFDCIPSGIPYRPERLTPKPKLYGIMNGTIDSELDTGRADIDELGRYKVMMPFDISGVGPGMGSRRIRMAQPYGGGGSGMSFPLIKGTEVIWTCIDGDIDRPIITGAVPNPLNPSVTTHENNTSNVIKTSSGITVSFNDGAGSGSRPKSVSGDSLAAQKQNQKIADRKESSSVMAKFSIDNTTQALAQQQQASLTLPTNTSWQHGEDIHEDDTNYQVMVPHGDKKAAYLRMGSNCGDETITNPDDTTIDVPINSGWVDYTDGDRLSVTQGKKIEIINGGNYDLQITDGAMIESNGSLCWHDSFSYVGGGIWRRFTVDWTCETHLSFGDTEEVFAGAKFEGFIGLSTDVTLGGSVSMALAAKAEINGGYDFSFGSTVSNDSQDERLEVTVKTHQMTAGARVRINVCPPSALLATAGNKTAIAGAAAIGVLTTAALVATPLILEDASSSGKNLAGAAKNTAAVGIGYGAATALLAGLTAKGLADVAASKSEIKGDLAELDMEGASIRLGLGPGPTSLIMPGIDISSDAITLGFGASQIKITAKGIELYSPTGDIDLKGKTLMAKTTDIDLFAMKTAVIKATGRVELSGTNVDLKGTAGAILS
jgi:Rhs element Vgr protein